MIRIGRLSNGPGQIRVGLWQAENQWLDLSAVGCTSLTSLLDSLDPATEVRRFCDLNPPRLEGPDLRVLAPVESQEIWAAGVTYLRSKTARMEESSFSATAYDRVYEAERPELFFKALPQKVSGPKDPVGIRRDSRWSVPEPELALVLNARGGVAGYTIGNDMSSRDIEGENLLYLPQAKIYRHSCALGPVMVLGVSEAEARRWSIRLQIQRGGAAVFAGETTINQIKRTFAELAAFLFRSQDFPHGAVLLTGTGLVPPEGFSLQPGDRVTITVPEIGQLENTVVQV